MEKEITLADLTFVGVTKDDTYIFNHNTPKIILKDIVKTNFDVGNFDINSDFDRMFQPIVKLENCVWLQEY